MTFALPPWYAFTLAILDPALGGRIFHFEPYFPLRSTLFSCTTCSGLIPTHSTVCPNCRVEVTDSAPSSIEALSKKALRGALVACTSMTLMACYGAPAMLGNHVCEEVEDQTPTQAPLDLDLEVATPTIQGDDSCIDSSNNRLSVPISITESGQYTISVSAEFSARIALYHQEEDGTCGAPEECVVPDGAGGMGGTAPENQGSTLTRTLDIGEYVVVVEAESDESPFDPAFQLIITRSN